MIIEVQRRRIRILPEQFDQSHRQADTAYIEEVLGLWRDGDEAIVRRVNSSGVGQLAYLEIVRKPE